MTEQPGAVIAVPSGVVITQEVMYAELRATHDAIIVLGEQVKVIGDHEGRLRTIERRMWLLSGAATVLGTVGGSAVARLLGGA